MDYLLPDTNVVSFFLKQDTRAEAYRASVAGKLLAVSFQTVAELEQWVLLRKWGDQRKAELEAFPDQMVILDSDRTICQFWGKIRSLAKQKGHPIDVADAWIGATALAFGLPLVTHNRPDFQYIEGLTIISAA